MATLLIAVLSGIGFVVAYHTYGRYLARRIFRLDPAALVPARQFEDGVDYVPTRREVIFGHHFTSIAGTGPIVGPAIAVFWGWLPALLWVLVGSVFIGAVHDFGVLVVSLRARGQTIGDVAGDLISRRARILFLAMLFFSLTVVIAIFGLIIAVLFAVYPQTVLSVWAAMPIAVGLGFWIYRRRGALLPPSLVALLLLYSAVYMGAYYLPVDLTEIFGIGLFAGPGASGIGSLKSAVVFWTALLLVYCYIASVLPVWVLLQPRDYINSHQLFVSMFLLGAGLLAGHPPLIAPALNANLPADAPPMFPFLFIIIACGAVSGFHCLVSSGTTSKQLASEPDAQLVGYGGMLLEGGLAMLVILACCAGIGLGVIDDRTGGLLTGDAAWRSYYGGEWGSMTLARTVGAFVGGGARMISTIGVPYKFGFAVVAVMVACFATTTLDTATRLQRYVIQELSGTVGISSLRNKYLATLVAVTAGGALALIPGPNGPGSGGLIIWPLFGATNQLLGGLALLVVFIYLVRHNRRAGAILAPAAVMLILPAWAMIAQLADFFREGKWLLFGIGLALQGLQFWVLLESFLLLRRYKRARAS